MATKWKINLKLQLEIYMFQERLGEPLEGT